MIVYRISRILFLAWAINFLLTVRPAICDGSSPGFSPNGRTESKSNPLVQNTDKPSVLDKMTAGTKKFISGVGNALTFKKTAPPKTTGYPVNPYVKPPKEEKSSWFTSIFHKEEPKKNKSPSEWMQQPRVDQ
jgi:hypothetical protein